MKKHTILLMLLTAASAVLLINLGKGSLSSWDEAFYAEVSREITESGNWIDLTWTGVPWSDKPPLYMWMTACFYKIFGINEFSARFFSAIAGIFTVIFTYLLGTKIFSRKTGFLAAVMLASTYHFLWFARSGTLDVTFTLFTLSSVYFFLLSEEKRTHIIYSFICFSLAFLTKGVGALLIPVILGSYVIIWRKWYLIFNRYAFFGVFTSLVILSSWYIPAYLNYGSFFIKNHFLKNLVTRTTGAMDGHYGNWITYINVILYKAKPWGMVGLISLPFLLIETIKKRNTHNSLLIIWAIVTFCIFSAAKTKLHWYIMPIYPAIMIIGAWGIEKILRKFSLVVVITCSLVSLLYFGVKKDIFYMDFNPEIKAFAATVKETSDNENIYLYRISDPGMSFYLGRIGRHISGKQAEEVVLTDTGDAILVTDPHGLGELGIKDKVILSGPGGVTATKVR